MFLRDFMTPSGETIKKGARVKGEDLPAGAVRGEDYEDCGSGHGRRRNKVKATLMNGRPPGAAQPTEAEVDYAFEAQGEGVAAGRQRGGRQVGAPSPALLGWDSSEGGMCALGAAAGRASPQGDLCRGDPACCTRGPSPTEGAVL